MTHHPNMTSFRPQHAVPVPLPVGQHYALHYHSGIVNHCPACSGTQWFVGRTTAQCARCESALPLAQIAETPMRPLFITRSRMLKISHA